MLRGDGLTSSVSRRNEARTRQRVCVCVCGCWSCVACAPPMRVPVPIGRHTHTRPDAEAERSRSTLCFAQTDERRTESSVILSAFRADLVTPACRKAALQSAPAVLLGRLSPSPIVRAAYDFELRFGPRGQDKPHLHSSGPLLGHCLYSRAEDTGGHSRRRSWDIQTT